MKGRIEPAVGLLLTVLLPWLMLWQGTTLQSLLGDGSTLLAEIPWRIVVAQSWLDGSPPLWTPLVHSGSPLAANIQVAAWYPPTLLFGLLQPVLAHNVHSLLHLSLAGCGLYLLLREHRLAVPAALVSAITYQCSGFSTYYLANTGVLATIAWLPVLLWLTRRLARTNGTVCRAALALACFCALVAGHPQFAVISLVVWAGYSFVLLRRANFEGPFVAALLLSATIGVLLAGVQLLPTAALYSAGSYSGPMSFADFAAPVSPLQQLSFALTLRMSANAGHVRGGEIAFLGYVPILLAAATLWWMRHDARVRWAWLLAVVGVVLTAGEHTPLAKILYELPVAGFFRAASRQWLLTLVAVAVLAGIGTHRLVAGNKRPACSHDDLITKGWLLGGVILLAHTLVFRQLAGQVGRRFFLHCRSQQVTDPLPFELAEYLSTCIPANRFLAGMIAAGFVASVLALIWWLRRWRGHAVTGWLLVAITLFHFHGNMWCSSTPVAQVESCLHRVHEHADVIAHDQRAPSNSTDAHLRRGPGGMSNERVVSTMPHWKAVQTGVGKTGPWQETCFSGLAPLTNLYCGVPSVGGWGRPTRPHYADLVGIDLAGIVHEPAVFGPGHHALDLLNVRYVTTWDQGEIRLPADESRYRLLTRCADLGTAVYERLTPFGSFWFVEEVRFLPADEITAIVRTGRGTDGQPVDLRQVALLEDRVARDGIPAGPSTGAAQVTDVHREGRGWRLRVSAATSRFLVFSEVFDPSWEAAIDGQPAAIQQTDALLRGVAVPAGSSELVLRYRPASFDWGGGLSLIGCALLLLPLLRHGWSRLLHGKALREGLVRPAPVAACEGWLRTPGRVRGPKDAP